MPNIMHHSIESFAGGNLETRMQPKGFYNALSTVSENIEARGVTTPNILVGDFDIPSIDWDLANVKVASKAMHEKNQAQTLLQFMKTQCFAQVISEPAREENILNILTNNEDMLHQVEVRDPLMSNHRFVKATLWCKDLPPVTENKPDGAVFSRKY